MKKNKLGRNEPCFCGSGIKFKKCHLNRESEPLPSIYELSDAQRKEYGKKYCLCPAEYKKDCTTKIIKAHTVSKSSSLKSIAENGHVYGLKPNLLKIKENQGALDLELIGINQASTFTGFCSEHDKNLFSPFEDKPFNCEKKQVFLIAYRALSREYFAKSAQNNNSELLKTLDRGLPHEQQVDLQSFLNFHSWHVRLGMMDLNYHKKEYDKILVDNSFDLTRAYIVEFDKVLPIQASGTLYPEIDFKGNKIQDLESQNILNMIAFSVITEGDKSFAVFTWLPDSDLACGKFIDSLSNLNENEKISAIFKFTFFSFENTFISPKWFDSLDEKIKCYVRNALQPIQKLGLNYSDPTSVNFFDCSIKSIKNL